MAPRRGKQPPYLAIAAAVREKILSGELAPGDQVPSMHDLAEQFGVTRGTALRALKVLKEEGLTETSPGWGTFVAEK
jgi:DNA-binding GntR family transcriptional regulator